jgi:hypothetical protein
MRTSEISGVIGLAGFYDLIPANRPEVIPVFASVHDAARLNALLLVNPGEPPFLLLAGRKNETSDFSDASTFAGSIQSNGGRVRLIGYDDLGHIGVMLPFSPLFHDQSSVVDDVVDFMTGKAQQ